MTEAAPTAAILIIGDEILSGRTQDANVSYIGQRLSTLGIRLQECRIVPDVPAAIVGALNALRTTYTYVFTTGGIGPTHDDITTDCIALAFERQVVRHPKVVAAMTAYFGDRLNDARLRMANVPDGPDVTLIDSALSIAPGYRIENVFVLAGVPSVAREMFESLAPTLQRGAAVHSQSVDGAVREGDIAAVLSRIQTEHPRVTIGSYPQERSTSIVARSTDKAEIAAVVAKVAQMMRDIGAEPVVGPAP